MLIQKLRLKRGWSQQQLADASGLSVRTIQRIETGHPLVNDPSWFGLIGPAKLPPQISSRLHAALVTTLKNPDALKRLTDNASVPVGNSPEAFRKVVADALDNTRKVVREANLKFE